MEPSVLFFYFCVALLGAIIGSFLNVVVLRFGTGKGLGGRSACGACNTTLAPYDLVPVFSYLLLRGRCRQCGSVFSVQYVIVELLTAIVFVFVARYFSGVHMLVVWVIASCALCIAVYDWMHMRIPALWNYMLMGLTVVFIALQASLLSSVQALVGAVVVSGIFFVVYTVSRGRVLGWGDVLLAISIGGMLGARDGLFAVWLACVFGSCIGGALLLAGRIRKHNATYGHQVPFGPFLIAGLLVVLCGVCTSNDIFAFLFGSFV